MRLFGTNGIREVVGPKLTPEFTTRLANAIAGTIPVGGPVVVGWDGRTSSRALSSIVSSTLALAGHHVIEVGLLPTPAIQYMVVRLAAQLGVVITASHNPPEFNGFKCIHSDGLEIPRSDEEEIERRFDHAPSTAVPYRSVGEIGVHASGAREYVQGVLARVDGARISARTYTVVLDVGNGTAAVTSPDLLRKLGCRVVTLNGHVDGTFPGRPSEPTEANVADLRRAVPSVGADLGIAHDGDADRAVFVERSGRYVPGEEILALLARDAVRRHGGGIVVTPVTAPDSVEEAVQPLGGEVVYTRVGSPNVTREMLARHAVIGGEENGGLIFPEFQLARDGAMTVAVVLDLMAREGQPLDALLAGLPRHTLLKEKVPCPLDRREEAVRAFAERFGPGAERVVTIDGVKIYRAGGWVLLRPSGTEPLLRLFTDAKDPQRARDLADEALAAVHASIGAERKR
ncbi:MAG: phosphoglucosamine mutase [Thermoplasmata archaeon]|nr:phosphoglucosamine mutase [Thermoplasmata archaeon]